MDGNRNACLWLRRNKYGCDEIRMDWVETRGGQGTIVVGMEV